MFQPLVSFSYFVNIWCIQFNPFQTHVELELNTLYSKNQLGNQTFKKNIQKYKI